MKIKTSELTDFALDWAVAIAKGVPPEDIQLPRKGDHPSSKRIYRRLRDQEGNLTGGFMSGPEFLFSSKWEAGGPLISDEKVSLATLGDTCYCVFRNSDPVVRDHTGTGPASNPLIAICRCYVASKLGDTVDIPEELLCPSPLTNSAS